MVTFLTSSPTKEISRESPFPMLDERNGFLWQLEQLWPEDARCLMLAADPDAYDGNDEMTDFYFEAVKNAGLPVAAFDLWDARHPGLSEEEFHQYDVLFLSGGHVPTQRWWFEYIRLRELMDGFEGLVIGTSAGSMNAAQLVYAWPEQEGESLDPNYELFFEGLGLAGTQILPHYQKVKDCCLDGRRLVEDIACSHSYGHRFLMIPDGSYVLVQDGLETVFGEAYLVADGQISKLCEEGDCKVVYP